MKPGGETHVDVRAYGWADTPKRRQCRALLCGTPEDRSLAKLVYNYKLLMCIERELAAEGDVIPPKA